MQLDNFILKDYYDLDIEHKTVAVNLYNDPDVKRYFSDFLYYIELSLNRYKENFKNRVYVVYYGNENYSYPVGMLILNVYGDKYELSYAILKEYRGEHLATMLLQEYTEYFFDKYKDIDKIYLHINTKNTGSIKVALYSNFVKSEKDRTSYVLNR